MSWALPREPFVVQQLAGSSVVVRGEPDANAYRQMVAHLPAEVLAKQEYVRISARAEAGMERPRDQGKRILRPPVAVETREERRRLTSEGHGCSLRKVARVLGVSVETVRKKRVNKGSG